MSSALAPRLLVGFGIAKCKQAAMDQQWLRSSAEPWGFSPCHKTSLRRLESRDELLLAEFLVVSRPMDVNCKNSLGIVMEAISARD